MLKELQEELDRLREEATRISLRAQRNARQQEETQELINHLSKVQPPTRCAGLQPVLQRVRLAS